MPSASTTIQRWEAINPGGLPAGLGGLNTVEFTEPKVSYEGKSDGGWVYLEGFEVTLDGKVYDGHITITKPLTKSKDSDEWHLCHLTVTRAGNPHVFYEVNDDGSFSTTTNLLNYDGKVRNGKEHYPKAQINDAKLADAVEHDIRLIFRYVS